MGLLRKIKNILMILKIYYCFSFYPWILAAKERTMQSVYVSQERWAKRTCQYLQVKFHEFTGSKKFEDTKKMVFANHKSQADFFLHNYVLDYKANFLARYAVVILLPFFAIAYHTVWFFNRDGKKSPEEFNQWLDSKFENSPRKSLIAYIEGHRMTGSEQVDRSKLKTGMIRYAYRRKIPAQFLMTFGNEKIFNEKKLWVSCGETAYYKISQVINPNDFDSQIEFVNHIKTKFVDFFDEVHAEYQKIITETSRANLKAQ